MMAVATLVAKNYLPFARVLAESLHRWHPELPLFVALMDEPEGRFDPAGEAFTVVKAEELAIPNRRGFCFRYTRREALSAAKPHLKVLPPTKSKTVSSSPKLKPPNYPFVRK